MNAQNDYVRLEASLCKACGRYLIHTDEVWYFETVITINGVGIFDLGLVPGGGLHRYRGLGHFGGWDPSNSKDNLLFYVITGK